MLSRFCKNDQTQLNFAEFGHFGVTPKLFDFIKFARFWIEHMHYRIKVVHKDPFGIGRAFHVRRHGFKAFLYLFIDAVRNCFDVCVGISFTDNKEVCRSVAEIPEIELNNVFTFFVLDTFHYELIQLLGRLGAGIYPPGCCQIQIKNVSLYTV